MFLNNKGIVYQGVLFRVLPRVGFDLLRVYLCTYEAYLGSVISSLQSGQAITHPTLSSHPHPEAQ